MEDAVRDDVSDSVVVLIVDTNSVESDMDPIVVVVPKMELTDNVE